MNVLFVASECTPIVKVGGLADVVGSLPLALKSKGIDIKVIIPMYQPVREKYSRDAEYYSSGNISFKDRPEKYNIYVGTLFDGIEVYYVENESYISDGGIYPGFGEPSSQSKTDEIDRFVFFSRAVVDFMAHVGEKWRPDVIHAHDWHTGLIPYLAKKNIAENIATIFTIHNLANQGISKLDIINALGAGRHLRDMNIQWDARDGNLDLLLQGILGADVITTVSPRYAEEITTEEFGEGLEHVLFDYRGKLYGILNGIDYDYWDPSNDEFLVERFSMEEGISELLQGKLRNKEALYGELNHNGEASKPLVGVVSRLTSQKGFDLISQVVTNFIDQASFNMVVLGTGDDSIEQDFLQLHKNTDMITFVNAFDEGLAHRIYAASDIFLIPSRFEPCGLTQMISMRYGGIPVVRGVGGLFDTVQNGYNGFVFERYDGEVLWNTLMKSIETYEDRAQWEAMLSNVKTIRFDWNKSADQYISLYKKIADV